ncbi:general transcription factor 3C polypeptide 6-like [Schistocerca serialis cubense]|uniref:general transcription factor 3C polypeptide 6-like n=1 Tax=Schistocerca serialis cubense TaxID=2023355 RepID=UPI00214E98DB|nr:general transcription factor 3C polypeptide 6-like [Schistocerca serialis cubense]
MDVDAHDVESSEQDDEYEEEEILVELKFEGGNLHEPLLNQKGVHFKLIGATTAKPVLQLGEQIFAGQYVDAMGTTIIFEEDESMPYYDPVFSTNPESPLRYYASTRKCLVMSRIFIKEKKEGEEAQGGEEEEDEKDGQYEQPKAEPSSAGGEKGLGEEGERGVQGDVADDADWETEEEK